jgi:hypothetical protein
MPLAVEVTVDSRLVEHHHWRCETGSPLMKYGISWVVDGQCRDQESISS